MIITVFIALLDNNQFETEKEAIKSRYTTAEAGITEKSTGFVYKNPNYMKNRNRSLSTSYREMQDEVGKNNDDVAHFENSFLNEKHSVAEFEFIRPSNINKQPK